MLSHCGVADTRHREAGVGYGTTTVISFVAALRPKALAARTRTT
jgi:hypothetical protein